MSKSFGKLTPEEMAAAVNAPAGQAVKILRKADPLWGRGDGEKIKWRARCSRRVKEYGSITVEATSQEEAERLIERADDGEFSWGDDFDAGYMDDGFEIEDIEAVS